MNNVAVEINGFFILLLSFFFYLPIYDLTGVFGHKKAPAPVFPVAGANVRVLLLRAAFPGRIYNSRIHNREALFPCQVLL